MKNIILLCLILGAAYGCNLQPLSEVAPCPEFMGYYDTSQVIKAKFLQTKTTIVHFTDDSCCVIWGKVCDFEKGERLFILNEKWYGPGPFGTTCKYFLINEAETLKYTLKQ